MKHLFLFEDFDVSLNEDIIPVYNEDEFTKNINTKPVKVLKYSQVIPALKEMLKQQKNGEIDKIYVIADVPTQGKDAPDYVQNIIDTERERLARKWKSEIGKNIEMGMDKKDFDFDLDRFGDKSTIFFDSEFIVDGIQTVTRKGTSKEMIVGIPFSLKNKGFKAFIEPIKVDEIYFTYTK